jgi:hypothetical protein
MIHQQGSVREWLGKFTLAKPTHDEIEAAKKWAAFAESKYSDKWVCDRPTSCGGCFARDHKKLYG